MKRCSICKEDKELRDYNKKHDRKDGLQSHCRECSHKKFKDYYNNNRDYHLKEVKKSKRKILSEARKFILDYLSSHPCVDCGESDLVILEFDHVRGKKIYNVTAMVSSGYSRELIETEISKCDIRCCNCHRRRTSRNNKCYRVQSSTG